jgi:Arc/MetJ-type ribon-helix-helix transcriptional regulator
MGADIIRLNDKRPDSEKITINIGYVDLGHIDLLVHEGYYSNRSDFIRTAIRNQLSTHSDAVRQSVSRLSLEVGLRRYDNAELQEVRRAGDTLRIQVLGLCVIDDDVNEELALATIQSITVLGGLQARPALKAALSERIR